MKEVVKVKVSVGVAGMGLLKDECGRVREGREKGQAWHSAFEIDETPPMALSAAGRMFGRLLVFDDNLDLRYLVCSSIIILQVWYANLLVRSCDEDTRTSTG